MPKVKVLNQMAVVTLGYGDGETVDVTAAQAQALIDEGYAEPVAEKKKVERATKAPDDEPKSAPRTTKK